MSAFSSLFQPWSRPIQSLTTVTYFEPWFKLLHSNCNYSYKFCTNGILKDIHDAKNACDHLSGFNVCNRYLVVLYYNPTRAFKKLETEKKEAELAEIRKRMGIKK